MSAPETFIYVMRKLASNISRLEHTLSALRALATEDHCTEIAEASGIVVASVHDILGQWEEALA